MTHYNWQKADWPHFRYELANHHATLLSIAERMGRINGKLSHLPETIQQDALLNLMVEEAIKTAEIEGEQLNRLDVISSIQNKLNLNKKVIRVHDKRAQGIADLMLDVRRTFMQPLNANKLFEWHLMLLSGSANPHLKIATWRTDSEPMQIVSGQHNKWVVHYEAPPASDVPQEMARFIKWFNSTAPNAPQEINFPPVRAAIAHLYFESIHPFEDGNGRIGRAIAEKTLSQGFGYPVMLSLSQAIEADKKAYYAALHAASTSNELTDWIDYFINVIIRAQTTIETEINFILKKTVFFAKYKDMLNERQLKVVKRMFEASAKGFLGGMSAKKYMTIAETSKATATRDMQQLLSIEAFKQIGSGRSVRYELNL